MKIFAYGEDALTLWAIKNKLVSILLVLGDPSSSAECQIFFRPSFGRRGGPASSQFGEFDFIILSKQRVYLGESKWGQSSERVEASVLTLRYEQELRHKVFKFYIDEWAFGPYATWRDFEVHAQPKLQAYSISKPIAPAGSLLATNLQTVLGVIRTHYTTPPPVQNVLLYLHTGAAVHRLPQRAGSDFHVVAIDYSDHAFDSFIRIDV